MRICYVLLSPTFGMHQYTADLANRMAQAGHDVSLVTTSHFPRDRYLPSVRIYTPVDTQDTGFSVDALRLTAARDVQAQIGVLLPDAVHLTGPHAWNISLLFLLRQAGIPTVHTLHDLDPHSGAAYGRLLHIWNEGILRQADHLLVHGKRNKERLLDRSVAPGKVTYTPLLHLSFGQAFLDGLDRHSDGVHYEPWVLFYGRMERYKGVDTLLSAAAMLDGTGAEAPRLILAGPGDVQALWTGTLPRGVEIRNRFIEDDEAIDLFRHCGALVMPYRDATQSALVAHAYFFRKPVIVTRTGALHEYVVDGTTGWVIPPDDPRLLAQTLQGALSDGARLERMGQAGRAWYERQRRAETNSLWEMYDRLAAS
ncbi:MAG: glycosyltransferase family 4 protein [Anaerolineae bacterium]